jgi:hypothetical protein
LATRQGAGSDHGKACCQECREQEERIAENAPGAPALGVPADDDDSAGQDQRKPDFCVAESFSPKPIAAIRATTAACSRD